MQIKNPVPLAAIRRSFNGLYNDTTVFAGLLQQRIENVAPPEIDLVSVGSVVSNRHKYLIIVLKWDGAVRYLLSDDRDAYVSHAASIVESIFGWPHGTVDTVYAERNVFGPDSQTHRKYVVAKISV